MVRRKVPDISAGGISVVVVTYNSERHIRACLSSLLAALERLQAEVVVIDNASSDGTCAVVEEIAADASTPVRLVRNAENAGFTKAANQGLVSSIGQYVLLLNPDVVVRSNTIRSLVDYLEQNPGVGMVAPQLRFPEGRIQPSCRRFPRRLDVLFELVGLSRLFPRSKVFNRWKMGDFDHLTPREVDQPQGAFLLARREAVRSVGPLDERFVLFFSDVDWCRRFWEKGWPVVFRPEVYAIHHKGASVYAHRVSALVASHRDFVAYFRKYPSRLPLVDLGTRLVLLVALWPRVAWALVSRCARHGKGEA
ncbi:MAG: glycosyltransferase family 2 protein [candidate division KSB1 bacterium]|nr:glycosyltransferase family 2 protein [candidate division KSB1 bacterium]MDZ7337163.1 glycosyltransferase family 2 protein [candidate division KSB1 bacterium]MDZ7391814.1 glycosyltransferase family 2 protein [candidate division KSB1 bacterium]MDZ7413173.1 glycosyltransferase family 2 protein [candidate division KSB1 bacterium]